MSWMGYALIGLMILLSLFLIYALVVIHDEEKERKK